MKMLSLIVNAHFRESKNQNRQAFQHMARKIQASAKSKSPLILIDFDQTITIKDTIASLGQYGLQHQPDLKLDWSFFTDAFLKDYYAHKATLDPCNDWPSYVNQLNSFRPIESASLTRVSQHHVFKNMSRQQFFEGGVERSEAEIRPGCIKVLGSYRPHIRIVSLNWSKNWILGYLHKLQLEKNQIFSNDIDFQDQDTSLTGEICQRILTSGDKLNAIRESIVQDQKFVYIGDSTGDIEALVQANIGIVIGEDKSLLEALHKFGYTIEQDITKQSQLYRVTNWHQIETILDLYYTKL